MSPRSIGMVALAAAITLCQACDKPKASAPVALVPQVDVVHDDVARFLAGMPGRPDGPFHSLESTDTWKSYSSEIGQTWDHAQGEQFRTVNTFRTRELAPLKTGSSFVFYPFSGPDVMYLMGFFPGRKTYVLAGLEPVGTIKPPSAYTEKNLEHELQGWRKALKSIFQRSFFVTSEMDSEFRGQVANGLLPMILLLLERSGCQIEAIRYIHIEESGSISPEPPNPKGKNKGVEIRFHAEKQAETRTLYYFSTDLGPKFEENPGFSRFLDRQGRSDTLVKSASFLLHWKQCEAMRNYILAHSNLILQDDTGIPFHYFQNADWHVRLYGQYSKPDRPFSHQYQKDLAEAFENPDKVHELGFSLGYGYGRRPSSMMLAMRVNPKGQ